MVLLGLSDALILFLENKKEPVYCANNEPVV
jgi:hypothetical protein